jgi:AcrR family transcriptional regulator
MDKLKEVSRARYHSERRQEQAAATRQAIVDAARALFVERGYARTTVADIAASAHVAVPTVYVSVGPKPAILGELRKQIPVVAGVPQDTRGALAMASHPLGVIAGMVAGIRRLMETCGDLMFAIEAASPFEPVASEAWEEGLVIHRAAWGMAVEQLEALGALKQTLNTTKAADTLSVLSLPATWRTLSRDHGWTYDEIETWIIETAMSLVTEPRSRSRSRTSIRSPSKRRQHTE